MNWVNGRVLKMSEAGEEDILHGISFEEMIWFNSHQGRIPEISVPYPDDVWIWLSQGSGMEFLKNAQFYFRLSAAVFKIQHPDKGSDQEALDTASLEGVLRAYEILIKKDSAYKTKNLDLALRFKNADKSQDLVRKILTLAEETKPK